MPDGSFSRRSCRWCTLRSLPDFFDDERLVFLVEPLKVRDDFRGEERYRAGQLPRSLRMSKRTGSMLPASRERSSFLLEDAVLVWEDAPSWRRPQESLAR